MKKLIILLLSFSFGLGLIAQPSIRIVNVDASNFPIMRAEFIAKNAAGVEIRTPSLKTTDLRLIERNGSQTFSMPYTLQCVNDTKFSLILTIDKTTSMQWGVDTDDSPMAGEETRMTIAKNSAYTFLDALPGYPTNPRADIALTAFSQGTPQPFVGFYPHEILHDFTFNRDTVKKIIKNKISANGGGTNFNVALMGGVPVGRNDIPSILDLAVRARYTPVVVFVTDGNHDGPNTNPKYPNQNAVMSTEFADSLKKLNGIFYAISVGLTMPDDLKNITLATGGAAYSDKRSQSDIEGVYNDILAKVDLNAKFAPCYIEWTASCNAGNFTLELVNPASATASATYTYDVNKLPKLEIVPLKVNFLNVASGAFAEQTVAITARNGNVDFTNPTILDNKYVVSDWGGAFPFTLLKDASRNVKIKYTADNTNTFAASTINFESSACSGELLNVEKGYIFAIDINCGSATQGTTTGNIVYSQKFCNNSGADITINAIDKTGVQANEFTLTNITNKVVPNGTCVDIIVDFAPLSTTGSSAFYIVKTSAGDFQAQLLGGGSGLPDISGAASVNFPNTNCLNTSSTISYAISNPGVLDLNVTDVTFSNPDFSIVSPKVFKVKPSTTENIIVQFAAVATGNATGDMTIVSNADKKTNFIVALTAKREATKLTYVENTTVDFGVICPNVPVQRIINMRNDGDNISTMTLTPNSTSITATASNNDVAVGGTNQITIDLLPIATGNFSTTLIVRDQCGTQITVNITANVEYPNLTGGPLAMNSTIGNPQTLPLPIGNSKSRDVLVANAIIVDGSGNPVPEFTLNQTTFNVPANGVYNGLQITYTPVATNVVPVTGYLVLSGTNPCTHSSTITITGNPDLASADLSIGKYSGLVGQDIAVYVVLNNKKKFFESNAKNITFSVAFDETLLMPKLPTLPGTTAGGKRTITLTQPVNTTSNASETFTLNFTILGSAVSTSTLLEFVPTAQTDNKAAVISSTNGTFTLIPAFAKLVLIDPKDCKSEPGVIFDFPIKVDDMANQLVAFNEGFKTTIRFDASILETSDGSGTIVPNSNYGRDRIIDITNNMKFPPEADKKNNSTQATVYTLATLKLRPMLGVNRKANIYIENTDVIIGKVNIASDSVEFTLLGICEEGGERLFDADKTAFQMAQIMPNPVTDQLKIQFNALEKGFHKLWIANTLGENTGVLFDRYFEYGTYSFDYDISKMPSGTYRVIIESPTQTVSQVIQIVK